MEKSGITKIYVFVLIFALAGSGALFALDDDPIDDRISSGEAARGQEEEERLPKHTVTVDLGPLAFGLGVGMGLGAIPGAGSSGGWGIGAKYEFQPSKFFSFGLGGSLMAVNTAISAGSGDIKGSAKLDFSSWSADFHPRWYPWGKTFFLDGMLGYGSFTTKLSADIVGSSIDQTMNLSYFKVGGDLGWRIDFGKPGGFVFETSIGYAGAINLNGKSSFKNPVGLESQLKQLKDLAPFLKQYAGIDIPDIDTNIDGLLNGVNNFLGEFLFIGGPKVTLSLGWRF